MMKIFINILICFNFLFASNINAKEMLAPYLAGDWKKFSQQYSNQPVVIHFWGVSCAPCIKELPQWGKFLTKDQGVKSIFIQVDNASIENMVRRIKSAKIEKFDNFYLDGNFDEFIYYEVDKDWHGEIPMTIMIGKNGERQRVLGSIDFKDLNRWLAKQ